MTGGKGYPLGIAQEIKIWSYYQNGKSRNQNPVLAYESYKILWDFSIQNDCLIPTRSRVNWKENERTFHFMDFASGTQGGNKLSEKIN